MLGIYDSAECPVDLRGNPTSIDGFREGAASHFGGFPGGPLHGARFPLESDTRETLHPHSEVKIYARDQKLRVNKLTHRIRFENETESSVDLVIEPKNQESR